MLSVSRVLSEDVELTEKSTLVFVVSNDHGSFGAMVSMPNGTVTIYPTEALAREAGVLHEGLREHKVGDSHDWFDFGTYLNRLRIAGVISNAGRMLLASWPTRNPADSGLSQTVIADNTTFGPSLPMPPPARPDSDAPVQPARWQWGDRR